MLILTNNENWMRISSPEKGRKLLSSMKVLIMKTSQFYIAYLLTENLSHFLTINKILYTNANIQINMKTSHILLQT